MEDFVVKKRIAIKAQPLEVWDALINPDKTRKYFFGFRALSDWKVGSSVTFKGKIFLIKKVELIGQVKIFEPLKILQYTLRNGNSENFSTVTDELSYENEETILSVSDDVGTGKDAEKRYKRSDKAWDHVLKKLKEFLENR